MREVKVSLRDLKWQAGAGGRTHAVVGPRTWARLAAVALAATGLSASSALLAHADPTPPKPIPELSPEARRVRTFSQQDATSATKTVAREFPRFVGEKAWTDLRQVPGVAFKRYLGPQSALVDVGGKPAVVRSQLPIDVTTVDGLSPVDANLLDRGTRLAPRRPLAAYTLSKHAGPDLLAFDGSGLTVGPTDAAGSPGTPTDEAVIHPNIARDTDLVVKPMPAGAQFGWVLRSIDSPRVIRLKVTMRSSDRLVMTSPNGGGPEQGPDGGAVVIRGHSAALSISPTIAVDADGQTVPVTVDTEGEDLVIDVDTSNARMPVLVDPIVAEDQRYWVTNLALDFSGWHFAQGGGSFGGIEGSSYFGNGLYLYSNPGSSYASGSFAHWIFDAPYVPAFESEGAHIVKADFGYTVNTVSDRGSCIGEGIWNRQLGRYEATGRYRGGNVNDAYSFYPAPYAYVNCGPEGTPGQGATYGYKVHCLSVCGDEGGDATLGSPGNQALLTIFQGAGIPTRGGVVYMGSSLIFLSEQSNPHLAGNAAPADWTSQPFTLSSTATDYGLGMYRQFASAPGYAGATANGNCDGASPRDGGTPGSHNTGDRNDRCPQSLDLILGSTSLPEGAYDVTFVGRDVVDNQGSRAVPVRIDRTPPVITATGDLADPNTARQAQLDGGGEMGIDFSIADGSTSSGAARRSGVATAEIYFDDQLIETDNADPTCADSCAITVKDLQVDPDDLTEATHTIKVIARDKLGQMTSQSWTFPVIRTNFYASKLAAWKAQVEAQVRTQAPLGTLAGQMPSPPDHWHTTGPCLTSAEATAACEREVRDWGTSVTNWLTNAGAVLPQVLDSLPDLPLFRYSDDSYSERFVQTLSDEFAADKKLSATGLAGTVNVALSFASPIDLATITTTLGLAQLQGGLAFRGVLNPGATPIVGGQTYDDASNVYLGATQFYDDQRASLDEQIAELQQQRLDPGQDTDDVASIDQTLGQLQTARQTLANYGNFVTGIAVHVPIGLLSALRLSGQLDVIDTETFNTLDDAREALADRMSPDEVVATQAKTTTAASTPATLNASLPYADGQSCDDRDEDVRLAPLRRDAISPGIFMPSRHWFDVGLDASVNTETGLHAKRHNLEFEWRTDRSLQWFCLSALGNRGYEEDSRVEQAPGPRWSTDWHTSYKFTSNIPAPHFDDLGLGKLCACNPYETQTYPDFSLTTAFGRAFRYGTLYFTRFRSNSGETDDTSTRSITTGSPTSKARTDSERAYCNGSRWLPFTSRSPVGSCYFTRTLPPCVGGGPLYQSLKYVRFDYRTWSQGNPCTYR